MIELVGSELVKRAAERAKRREERERAAREGRQPRIKNKRRLFSNKPKYLSIICSSAGYNFAGITLSSDGFRRPRTMNIQLNRTRGTDNGRT